MRFIVYWIFYTGSFCTDRDISGVLIVTDSTITSYICPYEYVEWKILEKDQVVQDNVLMSGEYLLDCEGYRSFLVIGNTTIYHYLGDGEFIYLTRKINGKKKTKSKRIIKHRYEYN